MPAHPLPETSRLRRYSAEGTRALVDVLADLQRGLGAALDPAARSALAAKARTARELAEAGAYTEVVAVADALERGVAKGIGADLVALRAALALSLASLRVEVPVAPVRPALDAGLLLVTGDDVLVDEVGEALAGSAFRLVVAADERAARAHVGEAHVLLLHAAEPEHTALLVQRLRLRTKLPPFAFVADASTLAARSAAARAGASLFLARPLGPMGIVAAARQLVALREVGGAHVVLLDGDDARAVSLSTAPNAREIATTRVADAADLEDTLARLDPDALIVGAPLPSLTPAEVCRIVRATPRWQGLPLFVCPGVDDPRGRVLALEAGADDVAERWEPAELAVRIRARTRHARMLRENASYDGVTGLLARGTFLDAAGAHLVEARRAWRALAVGFFRVREGGPDALALTRAAALLYGRFPPPSLLARWGDREIVVLCTGDRAANLRADLAEVQARLEQDFLWQVPPDVEIAVAGMPDDGLTLPALVREGLGRL